MRLSRKTLHALEAVLDIAYHARPEPVQSREITRRAGIPQRYLEQVMQQLVHTGILKGVRGPRGGYTLARERRKITVGEVVRVVELSDREEEDAREDGTSPIASKVVRPLLEDAREEMLAKLDAITLEDLCRHAQQVSGPAESQPSDFTI